MYVQDIEKMVCIWMHYDVSGNTKNDRISFYLWKIELIILGSKEHCEKLFLVVNLKRILQNLLYSKMLWKYKYREATKKIIENVETRHKRLN